MYEFCSEPSNLKPSPLPLPSSMTNDLESYEGYLVCSFNKTVALTFDLLFVKMKRFAIEDDHLLGPKTPHFSLI